MLAWLTTGRAILRSLRIYYGDRGRNRKMDAMYARFLKAGDLAFDVGSHVGDRAGSFLRLGAKVVAVEPQPALGSVLKLFYGRNPNFTLVRAAIGGHEGEIELRLNTRNPTVATASEDFIKSADAAPGWEGQSWDDRIKVPLTTLDALIARHGKPAFVKIDVEGFEDEVLSGLSAPLPALSIEFTTIQRNVALTAIKRLAGTAPYRFNAALGESQVFAHPRPLSAEEMCRWISELPMEANSGDIYAALDSAALSANPSS
ncbi:MAG: FkbM family methyltransferase [Rhizobiales bacterium]|nr:FkbM family methyltransferase [Hyphomicrobiales bacterium]